MSKPFSISLGAKKPSSTPLSASQRSSQASSRSSTPKPGVFESTKSSRSKFYHDDSEGEDEHPPTHEEVTAFDRSAGGAIGKNRRETEKAPLVIKVDSKNNWRDRVSRATKSWLPSEVQAQRAAQKAGVDNNEGVDVERPSTKHGLSFAQPSAKDEGVDSGEKTTVEDVGDAKMTDVDAPEAPSKPLTQEEQALQALISESKGEEGSGGRKTNMVIEGKHTNGWSTEVDETSSFRTDVDSRPEPASLADYAAVPVEEFGAALLRGMGWKEGEPVNKGRYGDTVSTQTALKARVPERRPGYLGIGAKDISGKAGSAELELGAWGKAAMRKAKKPGEGLYTPVLMRSKKSGEMVTEDEFKALQKDGQDKPDEWKERRDRNLEKYGRDKGHRNDDDNGDSDRPRRSGHSSRNASASPDRERRRRKDYDDENSHRKSDDRRRYRDRSRDSNRDHPSRDRDRGRDSDRDRRKSSRRSPEEESSRHRSSRRHDSDRDRERGRGRRDRHRDSSRDRR